MDYYIKCATYTDELKVAKSLNSTMELQLLKDFIRPDYDLQQLVQQLEDLSIKVKVLHSPLTPEGDVDINDLLIPTTQQILFKTCQLAQMLAEKQQQDIGMVIHYSGDFDWWSKQPDLLQQWRVQIQTFYQQFPNVIFLIENVPILTQLSSGQMVVRGGGYKDDGPLLVQWLREEFQDEHRFKTVVDTCHVWMTEYWFGQFDKNYHLLEVMKANQAYCGLIHLANAKDYGFGRDHGMSFEDDLKRLTLFYEYYETLDYDCPITIEVYEDDYLSYERYQMVLTQCFATHSSLGDEIKTN